MILAAAIKFHIDKSDKDVVLCGARHGDVFQQLEQLGFKPRKGYTEIEQGFIDHNNNFLTRKEAYQHAKMCGQIAERIIYDREHGGIGGIIDGTSLISEDLW